MSWAEAAAWAPRRGRYPLQEIQIFRVFFFPHKMELHMDGAAVEPAGWGGTWSALVHLPGT